MADVTDITTGTLNGTGYFDKFMTAMNVQIDSQFSAGRIQSKDAATVYLGALQIALTEAIKYVSVVEQVAASQAKTTSQTDLFNQQSFSEQAKIVDVVNGHTVAGEIGAKKAVQQAQAKGYSQDAVAKASKVILDGWSIAKAQSPTTVPNPAYFESATMNTLLADLKIKANS